MNDGRHLEPKLNQSLRDGLSDLVVAYGHHGLIAGCQMTAHVAHGPQDRNAKNAFTHGVSIIQKAYGLKLARQFSRLSHRLAMAARTNHQQPQLAH
jgi:hypothetical protein